MKNKFVKIISAAVFLLLYSNPGESLPQAEIPRIYAPDFSFQPLPDSSYMQGWNINFVSEELCMYITFVVTNLGPGNNKNGIALIIYHKGENRIIMDERSENQLLAQPGKSSITIGNKHKMIIDKDKKIIYAYITKNGVTAEINFKMNHPASLSGGKIQLSAKNKFIQTDVPSSSSPATAVLTINENTYSYKGTGFSEHILLNEFPQKYTEHLMVARSYHSLKSITIGGFKSKNKDFSHVYSFTQHGIEHAPSSGSFQKMLDTIKQNEPALPGLLIPKIIQLVDLKNGCSAVILSREFSGGIDVFGQVSSLLRWLLSVFFKRPFIANYKGNIRFGCNGKFSEFDAVISHYTF